MRETNEERENNIVDPMQKSMNDELNETIRSLRRVPKTKPDASTFGQSSCSTDSSPITIVETAKIRQLNKVAPLQYHKSLERTSSGESLDYPPSDTSTLDCLSDFGGSKTTLDFCPTTNNAQNNLLSTFKSAKKVPLLTSTLQRQQKTQSVLGLGNLNQQQLECPREIVLERPSSGGSLARTQSLRDVYRDDDVVLDAVVGPVVELTTFGGVDKIRKNVAPPMSNADEDVCSFSKNGGASAHRWSYTDKVMNGTANNKQRCDNNSCSENHHQFVVQNPIIPAKPPRAIVRPVVPPRTRTQKQSSSSNNDHRSENVVRNNLAASTSAASSSSSSAMVNKDTIVDLYKILDSNVADLKQMHFHSNSSYIQLSDKVQQFETMCSVYAENISPHGKFRFRELVTKLNSFIPRLRACASSSSNIPEDPEKLLRELESVVRDLISLVQR